MNVGLAHELRVSRTIKADPQAVWDAWTQPERMQKWCCPVPGGLKEAQVDLRIGGSYQMLMDVEGGPFTAFGVYREIDEPHRLVYTWDWREEFHAVGETLVTVEFEARDGGTEVVVTHSGFPAEEAKTGHGEGWAGCFANLEALFA